MHPYSSIALKSYSAQLSQVFNYVEEQSKLEGEGVVDKESYKVLTFHAHDVPKLVAPLVMKDEVIIDSRPFLRGDGSIGDRSGLRDMELRGQLERIWLDSPGQYVTAALPLVGTFSIWVGNAITHRFNAGLKDSETIKVILSAYYYLVVSSDELTGYSSKDLYSLAIRFIGQKLRVPTKFIEDTLELQDFEDIRLDDQGTDSRLINHFINLINEKTESPAIRLDTRTLFTLVSTGSWIGRDSDLTTMVAIEHPPTLLYMIYAASNNSFYKKTKVGAATLAGRRNNKTQDITQWVKSATYV